MNPFLFKAHKLLGYTMTVLAQPSAHDCTAFKSLMLIYLAINVPWTACFMFAAARVTGDRSRVVRSYLLALPATLLYTPLLLTLLDDVVRHTFRWRDRYLLVFSLLVGGCLLGGLYSRLVRAARNVTLGLEGGFTLAMALLLAGIPYALLLLGLDAWLGFFPALPTRE